MRDLGPGSPEQLGVLEHFEPILATVVALAEELEG